jgi:arsenate reductase
MLDVTMTSRVLFLCTHNSARSQMAEGLLRSLGGDRYLALSAGTVATAVRPEAVEVMREIGIDIGAQASKTMERFLGEPLDWLITVCDQAREACPVLPGVAHQLHWSIEDPAAATGPEEDRLAAFRAARDDLALRIRDFLAARDVEG